MGRLNPAPDRARSFAVVVHDVAPPFLPELLTLAAALSPRVGGRLIGAVVPCWHGRPLGGAGDERESRFLRLVGSAFGEVAQHGTTHHRDRLGVVSAFTGRADELAGLDRAATRDRLSRGREILARTLGVGPSGLIPPAWRAGHAMPGDLARLGFRYLAGFDAIRVVDSPPIPLVTWSWDWGILASLGLVGEAYATGMARFRRDALPCVAVHPADVARGYLPRILRVIDRLSGQGREPVLFSDLVPSPTREMAR